MKKCLCYVLQLLVLLVFTNVDGQIKSKADVERAISNSNSAKVSILSSKTEYTVKNSYTDEKLGLDYVYLQQTYKGIIVYNIVKSLVFKNNQLQYGSGNFYIDIASKAPSEVPSITADVAINKAASYLKLPKITNLTLVSNSLATDKKMVYSDGGISKQNINSELVWVSNDDGKTIHLAWNVFIEPKNSSDYFHVRVDAANGKIINQGNYTVYENRNSKQLKKKEQSTNSQMLNCEEESINNSGENIKSLAHLMAPPPPPTVTSATYNVIPFPAESPFVTGPTVETDPWNYAGTNNNATTYGWHFDGTTNYKNSRGNNVYVYDDSANKNKPGRPDTSSTAIPTLTFNFIPDFTKAPSLAANRKFAEANLFYWNNLMHDLTYQYGFTEAAGNFQANNLGRGGVQKDYVNAEAQDGSGTDNSNFSTQPDGTSGRMQMYLFNSSVSTGANITITTPSTIAGNYTYVESAFSTANKLGTVGAVSGNLAFYADSVGTSHIGCTSASSTLKGKIAVIYRGTCSFVIKVKNAQNAGAIGVIMINNAAGTPIAMGGTDNTITIPAVMVSDTDGAKIIAPLALNQTITATINVSKQGQMFDGDLDNSIVCHEYTHGISIRLTGGASLATCLNNYEEGGEGWSDYVALMMLTDWKKTTIMDGTKKRTVGHYALDQTQSFDIGVRSYPYSTDLTINPLTYKEVADTAHNPSYDANNKVIPNATEVHFIGEIWCAALWEMTWGIIQQEGIINPNLFDPTKGGGNTVALQLVMQGLKLQPCSPGFIDARNAILAADSILYNNAHKCAIWKAFAKRGMGYSAKQGSSNNCVDQTVAFDVPPCILPVTLISFNATVQSNAVVLKWATSAEVNEKDYVIEYSTDNTTWNVLGSADARNGTATNDYLYKHYQPVSGNNYYRIKMVENDGSYKYSNIVVVNFDGKEGISIYPNPVKETLTVEWKKQKSEKVSVQITDITGRILNLQHIQLQSGNNLFQLNTNKLSKGTYFVVINGVYKEVKQFIKE